MWLIIGLILVGAFLLVAELVLLPGLSFAGICSLIAYGCATYLGFTRYGTTGGFIILGVIIVVSIIVTILSLRARTWQKLSLKNQVDSTSQPLPSEKIQIGDKGITITRLAPIGKINIDGKTFEAKSFGDVYVDPHREIEVIGFENFSVIVKTL